MFEAVQFIEQRDRINPVESVLGESGDELEAVNMARKGRLEFLKSGSDLYAWWIVRERGKTLAEFIADSRSDKEFVLDLTSGQLVEV